MYGFCLAVNDADSMDCSNYDKFMVWGGIKLGYNPMPRFENDKLFYQDDRKIVLLDGVIFNKNELLKRWEADDWKECFNRIYTKEKNMFMDALRGSFCGIVIDKLENTLIAFSNHTGERPLYYKTNENHKCDFIASHVNFIERCLHKKGENLLPNIETAYQLLSTGTCLGHNTPYMNIFRITAGKYISIDGNGEVKEEFYHLFRNMPEWEMSLEDCIEKGDQLFRQAIERIYNKNREYGYEAECDLSGGLDSRMATFVAHKMGYQDILNMCYCVEGNLDHTTSEKISKDLGNRYSFLNMDGNVFLDVDEITNLVGGQVFYGVGTGSLRSLKKVDTSNIGMCITGLLGELENAYWIQDGRHTSARYITPNYWYSNFYPLTVDSKYNSSYENYEQMNIYELSFNLYISSTIVRQQICEVTSPFMDVDHIDFMFRVPLEYRKNYKFITSWMMKCYPEAAKYVWQTKGMPVDYWVNGKRYFRKDLYNLIDFPKRVVNAVFRRIRLPYRFFRIADMNPAETWYYRNRRLRTFFNHYYDENIDKVADKNLRENMVNMFTMGKPMDKLMVINYLGIYKRYFLLQAM